MHQAPAHHSSCRLCLVSLGAVGDRPTPAAPPQSASQGRRSSGLNLQDTSSAVEIGVSPHHRRRRPHHRHCRHHHRHRAESPPHLALQLPAPRSRWAHQARSRSRHWLPATTARDSAIRRGVSTHLLVVQLLLQLRSLPRLALGQDTELELSPILEARVSGFERGVASHTRAAAIQPPLQVWAQSQPRPPESPIRKVTLKLQRNPPNRGWGTAGAGRGQAETHKAGGNMSGACRTGADCVSLNGLE